MEYIFFRKEGFYFIDLRDDEDAITNAKHNEGTLKVEDTMGKIIWAKPEDQ